jgi:Mg2+/Co2+ transporter CorB
MQNNIIWDIFYLFITIFLGGMFSCLEIATVAIQEVRLKVLKKRYKWAQYAYLLKQELSKVLIFSLFGNSLANAIFTSLTTYIMVGLLSNLFKNFGLPIITIFIAFFIIIFSEALPKIIASRSPVMIMKILAIPMYYLFIISKPIVIMIDFIIMLITNLLNIKGQNYTSMDEVKALIADVNSPFKKRHQKILLNSINLDNLIIKEVLIPIRNIDAIDIKNDIDIILHQILTSHHTRIIVYSDRIDNIVGYIHIKDILSMDIEDRTLININKIIKPITFINDFRPIIKQINVSQTNKNRIFVVINEYGDVSGIACFEDMLEMIFGDFTTESPAHSNLAIKDKSGDIIVDGTMLIRELNELYNLNIELSKNIFTVNGLILKFFNGIPNAGVCFRLNNLIFEVISVGLYWVERVKIIVI